MITEAIRRAKLQSDHHHQQTNAQLNLLINFHQIFHVTLVILVL